MPLSAANLRKLTQLQCDHAALVFQFALIKLELAFDRALKAVALERFSIDLNRNGIPNRLIL